MEQFAELSGAGKSGLTYNKIGKGEIVDQIWWILIGSFIILLIAYRAFAQAVNIIGTAIVNITGAIQGVRSAIEEATEELAEINKKLGQK
jgi:uncharacterized membrane protein YccF (DUF307 family)